jgi:hypothetical protein
MMIALVDAAWNHGYLHFLKYIDAGTWVFKSGLDILVILIEGLSGECGLHGSLLLLLQLLPFVFFLQDLVSIFWAASFANRKILAEWIFFNL